MEHGETMRVCAACGSRDARVRAWVDCNSGGLDAPYCEDCDGKGWEVFDCGGVLEVQRCDGCQRLDTDDTAVEVAAGAGLMVSLATGEVEEDDADAWRDRYRPLRSPQG